MKRSVLKFVKKLISKITKHFSLYTEYKTYLLYFIEKLEGKSRHAVIKEEPDAD